MFAVVVGLGLWQFASHGQLDPEKWAPFTDPAVWQYLFVGLLGTLEATIVVAVLSAALGVVLAFGRMSHRIWISRLSGAYIEIARTVPVLLMIYLMLFGLPQIGINVPTLWKLAIPLTIANSAVFAEIIRAGVLSLPRGQREAALSLGMRSTQATRLVVLPQAVRNVTPSLVTQLVSVMKDTSLGFIVAFTELLYRGQVLATYLHLLIPTYIVVTLHLPRRQRESLRARGAPAATPAPHGVADSPPPSSPRALRHSQEGIVMSRSSTARPTDPALAELAVVERSGMIESRHFGSIVAIGPDGEPLLELGAPDARILPRSTVKPLQALACLTAGAELEGPWLAIAAGSHTGEDEHVRVVSAMLERAGLARPRSVARRIVPRTNRPSNASFMAAQRGRPSA